jgi:glutathione synthase/RimK-type ligase-like ATP-grasp enzyme
LTVNSQYPDIALVTARAARELDEDLAPLFAALSSAGTAVRVVEWDDANVDWSQFDFALLRSTWDYSMRLPEFLEWTERASAATRLVNPAPVVRWNTDKHYLAELVRADVRTVPSNFIEPGDSARQAMNAFLVQHAASEFVVKPAVSSGSRDAQRYGRREIDGAILHIERLLDGERSVVVQPYLDRVDADGETALIYFDGRFSHAIRKGALLRRGEGPTRALFATEHISARTPKLDELRTAERALGAIPFATPLYARVDLIRDADAAPCVLELELTEPSLFFAYAAGSVERFATLLLNYQSNGGS